MLFTKYLIYLTVSFKCAADILLNADLGKGKLYMLKLLTCKVHCFNWPSVIITDKKKQACKLTREVNLWALEMNHISLPGEQSLLCSIKPSGQEVTSQLETWLLRCVI